MRQLALVLRHRAGLTVAMRRISSRHGEQSRLDDFLSFARGDGTTAAELNGWLETGTTFAVTRGARAW